MLSLQHGELEAENERLNAYIKDFSIIDAGTGLKNPSGL